nr:L-tyrosine/L-tryptophan isonitrile synthase family protein [Chromobacterium sp. ASV5]
MPHAALAARIAAQLLRRSPIAGQPALQAHHMPRLQNALEARIAAGKPLSLLLPAFPHKSPNRRLAASALPDYGEYLALLALDQLCRDIQQCYPPGCRLRVFSDGLTFHDLLGVSRAEANAYHRALRRLLASPLIEWLDYASIEPAFSRQTGRAEEVLRAYLPPDSQDFAQPLPAKDARRERAWQALLAAETGRQPDPLAARRLAWRGLALDAMLAERYPDAIRLSIHEPAPEGGKFPIALADDAGLPWRGACRLDQTGAPHTGPAGELAGSTQTIWREAQPWLFMAADEGVWNDCRLSVMGGGRFGLLIESLRPGLRCGQLPPSRLEQLAQRFGFVVLRGFEVGDEAQLLDFTRPFGTPYVWPFGPVHKVRPEEQASGFVHSFEKLPLHWDLSMLPLDNPHVRADRLFSARLFALHCKAAPLPSEGQTTLVDARNLLREQLPETVARWRGLTLRYHTKFTYFGGDARDYPLIARHPRGGEEVLRFQEGSESALQTFSVEVLNPAPGDETLVETLLAAAYAPSNLIAHAWQDGDLALIDNYHCLHGRLAMSPASARRELWRVQTY